MAAQDRWPELLRLVKEDDGLPVRDCGPWTANKLWFCARYIDIVTRAMANHKKWNGLTYIDLFAGPGVCRIRETGQRLPGSALIAANALKPFRHLQAVELDSVNAAALRIRLQNAPSSTQAHVYTNNCNDVAREIATAIPERSLSLAFIDPPNLDIRFDTLRTLTTGRRMDLLILLADAFDIVRNVDRYEAGDSNKLDLLLPPSVNWRAVWRKLNNRTGNNVRELFSKLYQQSLKNELGYVAFRERIIESKTGPLYRLIFASQHERGADFWDKVTARERTGQQELF